MATLTIADLDNGKRDLETVDAVANSQADTTTTRYGDAVLTLAGVLRRLGYPAPVPYAPGLTIDSGLTTVERDGVIYAPRVELLPFTTGAWDAGQWRVVQNTDDSGLVYQFTTLAEAQTAAATLPEGSSVIVEGATQGHVVADAYVATGGVAPEVVTSYAELDAYSGKALRLNLVAEHIGGNTWTVSGPDAGVVPDGGTVRRLADGRIAKRIYSGAVMIPWFTQGTGDDTVALQAAFSAGRAIRDGGAGYTYNVNGTISLQDGQNLLFSGAEFKQLGVQKPMFNAIGKKRIRCRYGRFTGLLEPLYLNSASSQAICFAIEGADDVDLSHNEFENFMYSPAMSNAGANNVTFANNRVKGPGPSYFTDVNMRGTTGFTLGGTNVVVSGNQITGTTQGGIITQGSRSVSVANNVIHDLVNEHGLYLDTGLESVSVTGNVIRNTGVHGTGIKVQLYDSFGLDAINIVISGNAIYNSGNTSISVTNTGPTIPRVTSSVSITGNAVYSAGQDGISARYARGVTISGNAVYSAVRYGIDMVSCSLINTSGNSVANTGDCGIFDNGCGDSIINANRVNNPGTALGGSDTRVGIFIAQESEHFIANNVVRGAGSMSYGIGVYNTNKGTLSVVDNIISGAGVEGAMRLPGGSIRLFRPGVMSSVAGNDVMVGAPSTMQRGSMPGEFYGTAAPTSGAYAQGNRVHSLYPAAGGVMGWVCVVGGTPGTWRAFGNVAS